jgi:hypothetical protein
MPKHSKKYRSIFNKAAAKIAALKSSHLAHKIAIDVMGALASDFLLTAFMEATNLAGSVYSLPLTIITAAIGGAITHRCTSGHGAESKPKTKPKHLKR